MSNFKQSPLFDAKEINNACKNAISLNKPLGSIFYLGTKMAPLESVCMADTVRAGPNGTHYISLNASIGAKTGRLVVRMLGELHVGRIAPMDEQEVARINSEQSNSKFGQIKIRDRNPTINVQKYNIRVATDDLTGEIIGELPGPETQSEFYQMVSYINQFFTEAIAGLQDRKAIVLQNPRVPTPPGAIAVSSIKIAELVQDFVSPRALKNAGMALANPITRVAIRFKKDAPYGADGVKFYDKTKPVMNSSGGRSFEEINYTGLNIHNVKSQSKIYGTVDYGAICCSNMGISIPTSIKMMIIEPPVDRAQAVEDVFGDLLHVMAAAPVASTAVEPTVAALGDYSDDLESAVNDLGI
jgi:hypothetical protein